MVRRREFDGKSKVDKNAENAVNKYATACLIASRLTTATLVRALALRVELLQVRGRIAH